MQDDSSFEATVPGETDEDMEESFQSLLFEWYQDAQHHHEQYDDDHTVQNQLLPQPIPNDVSSTRSLSNANQTYIFQDGSALKPQDIVCGSGVGGMMSMADNLPDDIILSYARSTTQQERSNIIAEVVKSILQSDKSRRFVVPELSLEGSKNLCRPATNNEIAGEITDSIVARLNRPLDPNTDIVVCGWNNNNHNNNMSGMMVVMDTSLSQYRASWPGNQRLRNMIQRNDILLYSSAISDKERNIVIERILTETQCTLVQHQATRFVVPELVLPPPHNRSYYYRAATLTETKSEIIHTLRTFFVLHPDPHDIICGRHGEIRPLPLRNLINPLDILRFYRASEDEEKCTIFQSIESQILQFIAKEPLPTRFLIQGGIFDGMQHFREATPEEISAEIKDAIPMNFHFYPNHTQSIICGLGMLRNLVKRNDVLKYGRATKSEDRQKILQQIRGQLDRTAQSICGQPLWYSIPELWLEEQQTFFCRDATLAEIMKEIEDGLRFHFNLIAYDNDVVSGRGEPSTKLSGNIALRKFVVPNRHRYRKATKHEKAQLIDEAQAKVVSAGGRFLFPFDKASPTRACIVASAEYIRYKIIRMYNEIPERRTSEPCDRGRPKPKASSSGGNSV